MKRVPPRFEHLLPVPDRFKPCAPNVLIILIEDDGFGVPDTFGGEVHTRTLTKLRNKGICHNAFRSTSICPPTRAALLTGRLHHPVGKGTIAKRASDWDGCTGVIPKNLRCSFLSLHRRRHKQRNHLVAPD
jgi:arylsulfatase A-like enzyme